MSKGRNEVAEVVATGAALTVSLVLVAVWLAPGLTTATLGGGLSGAGAWLLRKGFGK